ncbi:hypothetical protein BDV09DRAFT_129502 [Aspergillus tetrazonus]
MGVMLVLYAICRMPWVHLALYVRVYYRRSTTALFATGRVCHEPSSVLKWAQTTSTLKLYSYKYG